MEIILGFGIHVYRFTIRRAFIPRTYYKILLHIQNVPILYLHVTTLFPIYLLLLFPSST
jgi:hypothetical protein